MSNLTIGLFNDSFPPTIDGVANVTVNYARVIEQKYGRAVVATPRYPDVIDDYPFEVIRYPSVYIKYEYDYRIGYPFDPKVISHLENEKLDIIHVHCPCISAVLARTLRASTGTPIVFTYHTKFDIDIDKLTASDLLRKVSTKALVSNIEACDDVWVVSEGAGENLRSLGYKGDYIVMPNGTDFARGRASDKEVEALRQTYGIAADETVFLFVGRMMWYKGVKTSLDGLLAARQAGAKFKFLLVGGGADFDEIAAYIKEIGMDDCCIMTGAVRDREKLRVYFTLADLFLFPSTFDTNGIVVREAAACSCPSLLIKGSCAAEGIEDGDTGIIIEESPEQLCRCALRACADREAMRRIGENACERIYISWEDAVGKAVKRYEYVLSQQPRRDDMLSIHDALNSAYEQLISTVDMRREQMRDFAWETRDRIDSITENVYSDIKTEIKTEFENVTQKAKELRREIEQHKPKK